MLRRHHAEHQNVVRHSGGEHRIALGGQERRALGAGDGDHLRRDVRNPLHDGVEARVPHGVLEPAEGGFAGRDLREQVAVVHVFGAVRGGGGGHVVPRFARARASRRVLPMTLSERKAVDQNRSHKRRRKSPVLSGSK